MAAAIKALNAKIRSNKYTDYFCSTHFWGPASNFGIPVAAVMDITGKDPEVISGKMTSALVVYSGVFMRYSLALAQGYRYIQYWHNGGREKKLAEQGTPGAIKDAVKAAEKVAK